MSKKIVGIAGSMKKDNSSSEYLLAAALEAAAEYGAETEMLRLRDYKIYPCEGCGKCMDGKQCHVLEYPDDQLVELYDKLTTADGFIFSSPVYALSLPAIWKNWIDRCEPCTAEDLDFEHYNYDRVVNVKGKALRGKVAGQIVVAAGPGHEWAMASLLPAFSCVKLSLIASVGVSLIEYDGQPGVQKHAWSKRIQDAEFAKMMARAVGIRVATAIGYSYFDPITIKKTDSHEALEALTLYDWDNREIKIKALTDEQSFAMVIGSQQCITESKAVYEEIKRLQSSEGQCVLTATVGQIPPFITKDFIKDKISQSMGSKDLYIDWDNGISGIYEIPRDKPAVLTYRKDKGWNLTVCSDKKDIESIIKTLTP